MGRSDQILPVNSTELSAQRPLEQENKDYASMSLLQIIQGRTTTQPDTPEEHSSQHSSQYLTASEHSLPSDLADYYGFRYDASIGTEQYAEDCPEQAQSDAVSSSVGNQMAVFGSAPAAPPPAGQYSFLQDNVEYRDPDPISTQSNMEDATLSDVSLGLSQDEPPILRVPTEHRQDIPPPPNEYSLGGPASFPARSESKVGLSHWSTVPTAGGGVVAVHDNRVYDVAPSSAGLDLACLDCQLDEESADNDQAVTSRLADNAGASSGDVLLGMAKMTLTNTQVPCTEAGEVPGDSLAQSVAAGPTPSADQSQTGDAIMFLRDCFPDQSETFLMHCWECSSGDIDACMDLVLTSSFRDSDEEGAPREFPIEYDIGKLSQEPAPMSVVEAKHCSPPCQSSSTSGSSSFGVPLAKQERNLSTSAPQALTDEEYARLLQAEYDKETPSQPEAVLLPQPAVEQPVVERPKQHPPSKERSPEAPNDDYLVRQYGEDEGFVLRLPRLLAYKLQDMYGSVSRHTEGGELSQATPLSKLLCWC